MRLFSVFALLGVVTFGCSSSTSGTGSSGGGGGGGGGGGDGGTSGTNEAPPTEEIAEKEPNNGPDRSGMQDIGAFSDAKTIIVKGRLESGGNDGQNYTGDFDAFAFSVAGAAGTMAINVDWTGSADVDIVLYNAQLAPVAGDNGAAKPYTQKGAAPAGEYAIVLYSKDSPADWTLTMTYTKPQVGSGGSCTSPLQANPGGGCSFTMNEPANGEAITLPYEFGWRSDGCETPGKIHIFGNPPTPENSFNYQYTRGGQTSLLNVVARRQITEADLAALSSDNGVYHWQLESFHGARSEARTFTIGPKTCK